MTEQLYYVISNSDGDTIVKAMTGKELIENLHEDGSGYKPEDVMTYIENADTNYWGEKYLIIKGEIVTPKPVTKVTEYEI